MGDTEAELGQKFLGQLDRRVESESSAEAVEETLRAAARQVATRDVVALFAGSVVALLLGLLAPLFVNLRNPGDA